MKHALRLMLAAMIQICALAGIPAYANDDADKLKVKALSEEAGLLLDEATALQPIGEKLAKEGEQLDVAEQQLRAESAIVNDAVAKFNESSKALERAVHEHTLRCPRESEDKALIESCNAMAVGLKGTAQKLDQERPQLQTRQQELKQRVDAQNAVRREWAQRKKEYDARVQANKQDAERWLATCKAFLTSDGFKALVKKIGSPPACEPAKLGDVATLAGDGAVGRVQTCLKGLAARF
ncbi:MAG TPA: hypothetical protein VFB54_07465 [Burkholderiales bacterium]|nr:hypothetical protein [Burkholderiales bacterium]